MLKKEARKKYREMRQKLTESERNRFDDLLLINFQSAQLPFVDTLLSFWPIEENNEPNTHLFTEFLKFRNPELRTCYPVSNFEDLTMTAVETDIDTPFEKLHLNIHEPRAGTAVDAKEIDIVFVPLLAFDVHGYRVGYGKGFYDIYLKTCRKDCIKVGFSYFEPIESIDDRGKFDIPLDLCITPQNLYVF